MKEKGQEAPLPMWGTMWIVNFDIWGEKLYKNSSPMDENVDGFDEEMEGQSYINGIPSVYIYEIDGTYVIGVHGAGWDFYDGVWDKLYDFFGLKWHNTKYTHFQCSNEAIENTDACRDHTFCKCEKIGGKYHAHYLPDCPNEKKGESK